MTTMTLLAGQGPVDPDTGWQRLAVWEEVPTVEVYGDYAEPDAMAYRAQYERGPERMEIAYFVEFGNTDGWVVRQMMTYAIMDADTAAHVDVQFHNVNDIEYPDLASAQAEAKALALVDESGLLD